MNFLQIKNEYKIYMREKLLFLKRKFSLFLVDLILKAPPILKQLIIFHDWQCSPIFLQFLFVFAYYFLTNLDHFY